MKINTLILTLTVPVLFLTGCQNPDGTQNNTGSGALIGGVIGAIAGATIGGPHHGGEGALIGAAAGAVGGGLIGNSMDQEQNARLRAQAPATYERVQQGQPLSLADIKALAKSQITDDIIISQINSTHSVYHLSAADIIDLRDSGVSNHVIDYMINTPNTAGAAAAETTTVVVQQAPPPPPVETVVVAPGPDYVWIGGEWTWGGSGWVWVGGHWGHPPYPHAVWVGGYTWHDHGGWHDRPGHWR